MDSGDVAKWQGGGLQNPYRRFESARRLQISPANAGDFLFLVTFPGRLHNMISERAML